MLSDLIKFIFRYAILLFLSAVITEYFLFLLRALIVSKPLFSFSLRHEIPVFSSSFLFLFFLYKISCFQQCLHHSMRVRLSAPSLFCSPTSYKVESAKHNSLTGSTMCWTLWDESEYLRTTMQRNLMQPGSISHQNVSSRYSFPDFAAAMMSYFTSLERRNVSKRCKRWKQLVSTPRSMAVSRSLRQFWFWSWWLLRHW